MNERTKYLVGIYEQILREDNMILESSNAECRQLQDIIWKNLYQEISTINRGKIVLPKFDFLSTLTITYRYVQPSDKKAECHFEHWKYNQQTRLYDGAWIEVFIPWAKGYIDTVQTKELLLHEVEHLYTIRYRDDWKRTRPQKEEENKEDTQKKTPKQGVEEMLYNFVRNHMGTKNPILHQFVYAMYYSNKEEQDSFTSQLYSYLEQHHRIPASRKLSPNQLYFKSQTYAKYQNLVGYEKEVDAWDTTNQYYLQAQAEVQSQHITQQNLKEFALSILKKSVKRYKTKMDRSYMQFVNDFGYNPYALDLPIESNHGMTESVRYQLQKHPNLHSKDQARIRWNTIELYERIDDLERDFPNLSPHEKEQKIGGIKKMIREMIKKAESIENKSIKP